MSNLQIQFLSNRFHFFPSCLLNIPNKSNNTITTNKKTPTPTRGEGLWLRGTTLFIRNPAPPLADTIEGFVAIGST
jgi:hypothetical protein